MPMWPAGMKLLPILTAAGVNYALGAVWYGVLFGHA